MTSLPIDSAGDFQGVGGGKVKSLSQAKKRSVGWWIMGFAGMLAPAALISFALPSMLKPSSYSFGSPDYVTYEPSSVNPLILAVVGVVVLLFILIARLDLGVFGILSIVLAVLSGLAFFATAIVGYSASGSNLKTWINNNEGLSMPDYSLSEDSVIGSLENGDAISFTDENGKEAYGFFSEVSENKYMFTRLAPVED